MRTNLALLASLVSLSAFAAPPPQPVASGPVMGPAAQQRYREAVGLVTSNNFSQATEVLNGLAAEFPRVPEIFASRCSAQLGLKHYPEAEADCVYALALKPQLASTLYALAIAEESQGKTDAAVGHYRQYASLDDSQAVYKQQAQARINALTAVPVGPLPVAAPPPPGAAPSSPAVVAGPQRPVGTLVIYRNHFMRQEFNRITLFLDGRMVGDIGHNQYVEIQAEHGEHFLEARTPTYSVFQMPIILTSPVNIGSAVNYINFDHVAGYPAMVNIAAEQARNEIREDCTRAYTRRM